MENTGDKMKMRNIDHPGVSEPKTLEDLIQALQVKLKFYDYSANSLRRLLRWAGDQLNKQETQCSGKPVLGGKRAIRPLKPSAKV
jgi:hypothetical protein